MLVENGFIPELKSKNLIHLIGQKTVQTRNFLHRNDLLPFTFRSWYDFSRTAASVLRMFMLEASGMRRYYDPDFSTRLTNLTLCIVNQPYGQQFWMAHGDQITAGRRARKLASEFDRLFPHSLIEYELQLGAVPTKTLSGHMYVIYFDEGIIYQIHATMDIQILVGMEIHANVHVVVSKYDFSEPNIYQSNAHEFKRFILLKQLVQEWMPFQTSTATDGVLPSMQNLTI